MPDREFSAKPRLSMRLRITLWVVLIFTLIQWTSGGLFWLYQSAALNRLFDEQLSVRAMEVAARVEAWTPAFTPQRLDEIAAEQMRFLQFETLRIDVLRPDGASAVEGRAPLLQDIRGDSVEAATVRPTPVLTRATLNRPGPNDEMAPSALVALIGIGNGTPSPYVVAVATSDAFLRRQEALVGRVLVLAGLIGPIAAAVAGWFIGGIAVAPFERLGAMARALRPESIGRALDVGGSNAEVARLAAELDEARKRILEGFSAQERFLSNVSHEIKTPIAVMLTEAQTIDAKGAPPHVREFAESMVEEMVRLGRLVESFLTLTRVRDGKGIARISSYAVNDLIIDSMEHCAAMARQHRVRLAPMLLDEDDTVDATIAGERELLSTMLDNLVRNAIRFSPLESRVEVGASVDGDVVTLRVRDYGPGIPPDRLETIFDRFAQAPEEQRKGRGHGLGLAIAQGIAELHGGVVRAENCEDEGCTFSVSLPLYHPEHGARADRDGVAT